MVANSAYIFKILIGCTDAVFVFFIPVFHEDSHNIITLLFQQICTDGGIYTAGNSNCNFTFAHNTTPRL